MKTKEHIKHIDRNLFKKFCIRLEEKIGMYYPEDRWHDLEKKLNSIKDSFGFADVNECLAWLMEKSLDNHKLNILTFHLTIGETYFFRDSTLFQNLEDHIFPEIIERHHQDKSIKIWSAGCCSGEEPYSIAILLHQMIPDIKNWHISILGSDINPEYIKKAQLGQYKNWSFRSTPKKILDRYFKKSHEDIYSLASEIKEMVTFSHFNLVDDPFPDPKKGIHALDLILCRNVLIYFSEKQIKKVVHNMANSLDDSGWLSVTAIEAPYVNDETLVLHKYLHDFFLKKELIKPEIMPRRVAKTRKILPSKTENEIFEECLILFKKKSYEEIIDRLLPYVSPFNNEPKNLKEHLNEILLLTRTYANQGNFLEALYWCELALKADPLLPLFHYCKATILQAQGKISDAIQFAKNALFIDFNFIMAHYLLGTLENQLGNKKAAFGRFKISKELIDSKMPGSILPGAEELTLESLKDLIANEIKNLGE